MNQPAYDESPDTTPAEPATSSRPIARFTGTGGLSVAVWKQRTEHGDRFSTRLDRGYKDAQGQYVSTPYLREGDLLRAQQLLLQADAWIEQEKGRLRGSAGHDSPGR